jgi:metal-responsive CopG/Arc/MetJ family transcriptional regulator
MTQSTPIAIRLEERVLNDMDVLIFDGEALNRTEFIRDAIEAAIERGRQRRIDRELIEVMERFPDTDEEIEDVKRSSLRWAKSLPDEEW